MPSKSEEQHSLMCMARGVKEGKLPRDYSKEATRIADKMSLEQLKEYCPDAKEK
jgi:hypothetical protein